jgi:hypothetical protein
MKLSQNFSFWESSLRFMGKSGLETAFSRAFPKTNRVLENAPMRGFFKPGARRGYDVEEAAGQRSPHVSILPVLRFPKHTV